MSGFTNWHGFFYSCNSATINGVNEFEQHHRQWVPAIVFGSGLALFGMVLVALYYFVLPQSVKAVSVANGGTVALDAPITVTFDRPVNRKALKPVIEPAVAGTWEYHDMLIGRHLAQSISFIPDTIYSPGTEYHLTLAGITNTLRMGNQQTFTTVFGAAPLPVVTDFSPADGVTDFSAGAKIVITLDQTPGSFTEWRFVTEPVFEFSQTFDGTDLVITPASPLTQGTNYSWQLERTLIGRSRSTGDIIEQHTPERVASGGFGVLPPPSIASVSPTGNHVLIDSTLTITFTRPMVRASVEQRLTLEPKFERVLSWSDDSTVLTITPDATLAFATDYAVTISAGAQDAKGGFLNAAAVLPFRTIGPVAVAAISPSGSGVTLESGIRVDFDQAVDHGSAEGHFTLQPEVSGSFSWDGLTLVFTPEQSWPYDTTYTVTVAGGVASIAGQPSERAFVSSFSTQPQTTLLNIAVDYQDRPLSCEAAALKMALAYKGVHISENSIMAYVGYDELGPRQGDIWGDPYLGFVGDIDGRQNTTGYGVYWDPIATAASQWRPSEAFISWTTAQILGEIALGNPVILWGVYPGGSYDPWQTAEGKAIEAWKGEHARTIVGFVGTPADPEQIIINDPVSGRLYWSRSTFEANAATFHFSGVVVR